MFGNVQAASPGFHVLMDNEQPYSARTTVRHQEHSLRGDTAASAASDDGLHEPLLDIGDPHVQALLGVLFSEHEMREMTGRTNGRFAESPPPRESLSLASPALGSTIDFGLRKSLRTSAERAAELRRARGLYLEDASHSASADDASEADAYESCHPIKRPRRVLSMDRDCVLRRERRANLTPEQRTRERELLRARSIRFRQRKQRTSSKQKHG